MSISCPPGSVRYFISPGDTLFAIARTFNTTVAAIQAANPGIDPNSLQVGRLICVPTTQPPTTCPGRVYTVRSGDTLFSIARNQGVSLNALQQANPAVDPNRLTVGQQLCIPTGPAPGPAPGVCPPNTSAYNVRSGDTFFGLAQRFGTTVEALRQANPNVNPNALQIGQRICIPRGTGPAPGPGPCPHNTTAYNVQSGDTFFTLAQRFGTTVEALRRANPNVNPNALQIGQRICIPR